MGDACSNPRRYAPRKPARLAPGQACAPRPPFRRWPIVLSPTQTPARLVVLSPTPVDGLVLSPTFCCGWACAITHKAIVLSPTRQQKKPIQINRLRHLSRRVTRARGFLTYKVFNVLRHKAAPPLRGQAPCRLLRAASGPPPAPSALPARHTPAPAVAVAISGSLRSQND